MPRLDLYLRPKQIAPWTMAALLTAAGLTGSSDDLRRAEFAPVIFDQKMPDPPGTLEKLKKRGRFTPTVRTETYDGRLKPHPLIEEAAAILVEELRPYAKAVYVTSLVRGPEDQLRLMKKRRYRYWTTKRSKHLLGGFAADIGFVRRKTNMWKMRAKAEKILIEKMGEERAKMVRVVRESRCIHIEIDSQYGREDIRARAKLLHEWGIVHEFPDGWNPVPPLDSYVLERDWVRGPRDVVEAVPG
jgi:hypothetical protein